MWRQNSPRTKATTLNRFSFHSKSERFETFCSNATRHISQSYEWNHKYLSGLTKNRNNLALNKSKDKLLILRLSQNSTWSRETKMLWQIKHTAQIHKRHFRFKNQAQNTQQTHTAKHTHTHFLTLSLNLSQPLSVTWITISLSVLFVCHQFCRDAKSIGKKCHSFHGQV